MERNDFRMESNWMSRQALRATMAILTVGCCWQADDVLAQYRMPPNSTYPAQSPYVGPLPFQPTSFPGKPQFQAMPPGPRQSSAVPANSVNYSGVRWTHPNQRDVRPPMSAVGTNYPTDGMARYPLATSLRFATQASSPPSPGPVVGHLPTVPLGQPMNAAPYQTGAAYQTGTPYQTGAAYQTGTPYQSGTPYQTGTPYQSETPYQTGTPFRQASCPTCQPWTMNSGHGVAGREYRGTGFCGTGFCGTGFCGGGGRQPFASYDTCYGDGCEAERASPAFWYAGVRALYMTRDRSDNVWLSLDTDNLPAHLLDSHDASMDWEFGFEGYVGRAFDCGRSALEGRYWGVYSEVQEASVLRTAAAGNFDTPIDFTPLVFDNGGGGGPEPVANFFLNAEIHRVQRSYEIQNVEVNFLRLLGDCSTCAPACGTQCGGSCGGGSCGGCGWGESVVTALQVRWVAGLRYFRFDEGFQFATDRGSIVFGDDLAEELYYDIDVANHLVGLQLGCRFDYASCRRWSLHGDTKLGLYGNHITHRQLFGSGNGAATIDDVGGPFNTAPYDISSTKNDASMIAEFDFGCDIAVSSCWTAGFGCRVVGVSGVALTTAQIPRYFEDLGEARRIDSTGSLLLHGGYAQIEYVR